MTARVSNHWCREIRGLQLAAIFLLSCGCGGSGSSEGSNSGSGGSGTGGAPQVVAEGLGLPCTTDSTCSNGAICFFGFCATACSGSDSACGVGPGVSGYGTCAYHVEGSSLITGIVNGVPVVPNRCAVFCDNQMLCPEGLSCSGPSSVCCGPNLTSAVARAFCGTS